MIDEDTFIILDGGDYVQWGRSYFSARRPGRFLRLGPLGHLGGGIPYGMAAKLAHPESKVLVFCGDGSFGFYPMEYDTCIPPQPAHHHRNGQRRHLGHRQNLSGSLLRRAVGTDLRFIRYDQVVQAIGGYAEYVEKPAEVAPGGGTGHQLRAALPGQHRRPLRRQPPGRGHDKPAHRGLG